LSATFGCSVCITPSRCGLVRHHKFRVWYGSSCSVKNCGLLMWDDLSLRTVRVNRLVIIVFCSSTKAIKKGSRFICQLPCQIFFVRMLVAMLCPLLEIVDDCCKHGAVGDQNVHCEEGVDHTGQSYQKIRFHFTPRLVIYLVSFDFCLTVKGC
jgi:hypothetical protein